MNVSRIFMRTQRLEVDTCKRCQFLWFDGSELAALPAKPPQPKPKQLPQPVREAIALAQVERYRQDSDRKEVFSEIEADWETVIGFFGLPIEHDDPGLKRYPVVTWTLAIVAVLISSYAFVDGGETIEAFSFIPSEALRGFGLTLLTSFLVHGGIFHLLSNLYFLLIFGDNVEDLIGRKRFLLLLAGSTIAGNLLHLMADPRTDIPLVGASGGISGIITLYALVFPQARIGVLTRYCWVNLTARTTLFWWIVLQFFIVWKQLNEITNVSALAHLGGCCAGFLYWFIVMRAAVPQTKIPPTN